MQKKWSKRGLAGNAYGGHPYLRDAVLLCPFFHPAVTLAMDLSGNGRHGTPTSGNALSQTAQYGENPLMESPGAADSTNFGAASFLPTDAVTIFYMFRKTDATNRESSAFGLGPSGGGVPNEVYRCGAHCPWSDGVVYWDFGGTSSPNRISVSGLSFADTSMMAFTGGPRGTEIWQNGRIVASATTAATRTGTGSFNFTLGQHGGVDANDLVRVSYFAVYRRQLSPSRIVHQSFDPFAPWRVAPLEAVTTVAGGGSFIDNTTPILRHILAGAA